MSGRRPVSIGPKNGAEEESSSQAVALLSLAALDHIEMALLLVDAGHRVLHVNSRYRELFQLPERLTRPGTPVEDLIGFSAQAGEYGPGDPKEQVDLRMRPLREGAPLSIDRTRPNGEELSVRGKPLPDGGYIFTFQDITQTVRTQHALERAYQGLDRVVEEKTSALRALVENLPLGVALFDSGLRLMLANDRFCELLELDMSLLRSGTNYLEYAMAMARRGDYGQGLPEELASQRVLRAYQGLPDIIERTNRAGCVLDSRGTAIEGGGYLRIVQDVSAHREAERRLAVILETMPFPVTVTRLEDGLFLYLNPPAEDMHKLPAAELIGRSAGEFYADPADREKFKSLVEEKGGVSEFEVRLKNGQGQQFWVLMSARPIEFAGTPALLVAHTDITARRYMEEALRDSERNFRVIFEQASEGIFRSTPEGVILQANPALAKLYGYASPKEMMETIEDMESQIYCDPKDREVYLRRMEEEGFVHDFVCRMRSKNGDIVWASENSRAVKNEKGKILYFEGTIQDITDRKKVEEELRASEIRRREVLEAMPVPAFILSLENNQVLYFTPRADDLFRFTERQAGGIRLTLDDLLPDPKARTTLRDTLIEKGRFLDQEYRFLDADGADIWGLASARLVPYEEEVAALVAFNSLNELKTAQANLVQAEKMASLGQLVAGVAHEINTPIGIGLTAASHLEESTQALAALFRQGAMKKSDLEKFIAMATDGAAIVMANINRAAELIQSFKRVASDQTSEERRRFDLSKYLDEIILSLKPAMKRFPHELKVECPKGLILDSYPGAVSQVITNLIMNTLMHAYEPGEVGRLTLIASRQGDSVELDYSDDGRGIPAESIDKIFDPFFTTKRGQGGTGLGLHIIFNLVNSTLGGTITCDRSRAKGARFVVRVPLVTTGSRGEASL